MARSNHALNWPSFSVSIMRSKLSNVKRTVKLINRSIYPLPVFRFHEGGSVFRGQLPGCDWEQPNRLW